MGMSEKDNLKNEILVEMRVHLDRQQMQILEAVLVKEIQKVEVVRMETLPATVSDSNRFIMELFETKKAPKISERTAEQYRRAINNLMVFTGKQLTMVNDMDIESYLLTYGDSAVSAVTVNNEKRFLSAFFTWMRKSRLILCNPCDCIEPEPEVEKPIDHLEADQMDSLIEGCRTRRDRALIEFLRCTAMRDGEVPRVRVCDLRFGNDVGKALIYGKKTRVYRTVCFDAVAERHIMLYLKERGVSLDSQEPLFVRSRGKAGQVLKEGGIYSAVVNIGKRSGIGRNIYPHLLRKTTATNIVKRGGSDEVAGEYLGHRPHGVTGKHYTYKSEDHIVQIFKRYVTVG